MTTIFNAPLNYIHAEFDPPHLVRLYCDYCERYSRPVRTPTPKDKQEARRLTSDPLVIVYPKAPVGWGRGCPRCVPEKR